MIETFAKEFFKIANERAISALKGLGRGVIEGGSKGLLLGVANPIMMMRYMGDPSDEKKDDYKKSIIYSGLLGAALGGISGGVGNAINKGVSKTNIQRELYSINDSKFTPLAIGTIENETIDNALNAKKVLGKTQLLLPIAGSLLTIKKKEEPKN